MVKDLTGNWVGSIDGTNRGRAFLELCQSGAELSGEARLNEPDLGIYAYDVAGSVGDAVAFRLTPRAAQAGISLGTVSASATSRSTDQLSGTWESSIGTKGVFEFRRVIS